jgi:hypothetical protein
LVGRRLRVLVTAANSAGTTTAASAATAAVGSTIESTMSWGWRIARRFTLVEVLTVENVPAGGAVEVSCRGPGCPFGRSRPAIGASAARCRHGHHRCKRRHGSPAGSFSLASLFANRHLGVGTQIGVVITKPNWVGKTFTYTVLSGRAPRKVTQCIAPGASVPGLGC